MLESIRSIIDRIKEIINNMTRTSQRSTFECIYRARAKNIEFSYCYLKKYCFWSQKLNFLKIYQ